MAWSSAELSADEIAWAAADLPILSNNALYASGLSAGWKVGSAAGTVASATEDAIAFDADRAFDGFPGLVTKPNAAGTAHSLVIDASASPITFDWVGVINHNLDTLAATSVTVEVADDAAFTTALQTITDIDVATGYTSDRRFADFTLFHTGSTALRYSSVDYLRIAITCSSGTPYIGQIVLGRRRQQPYTPNLPFDQTDEHSGADDFLARGGVAHRTSRQLGHKELAATFRHDTDALQTEITEWWSDIEGGNQPFFYCRLPNSAPDDFVMYHLDDPALVYPYVLNNTRDLPLAATEQGPHHLSQE